MARPEGTNYWNPIPEDLLWDWYWEELMTPEDIGYRWGSLPGSHRDDIEPSANREGPSSKWVTRQLQNCGIPQRSASERASLWQQGKPVKKYRHIGSDREHRLIYEDHFGPIPEGSNVHHQDYIHLNNHPMNLQALSPSEHRHVHNQSPQPDRIPLFEVYMRMAENIALRSHHPRTKVGCVITSFDLRRVLAVGFNGNAAGLANSGDSDEPGKSGMVHAEENALIQASEHGSDRVMFVTESPCLQCTKLLINAGIKYLYYRKAYRITRPLSIARFQGVMVCQYDRWKDQIW